MPMIADFLQRTFAVDFLFQPAQRFVHGLAFFESNFCQSIHFLSEDVAALGLPNRSKGWAG